MLCVFGSFLLDGRNVWLVERYLRWRVVSALSVTHYVLGRHNGGKCRNLQRWSQGWKRDILEEEDSWTLCYINHCGANGWVKVMSCMPCTPAVAHLGVVLLRVVNQAG